MSKKRGFEVVADKHRTVKQETPTVDVLNKVEIDGRTYFVPEITLPTRADVGSAGYDFYSPIDMKLLPGQKTILFTDVKAHMLDGEVLMLFIRSSLAVKQGLMLSNNVGIIDASYYSNEANDGNIGIPLVNTSGKAVEIKKGDRIAQGIFMPFLAVDEEEFTSEGRKGGFGSSGK